MDRAPCHYSLAMSRGAVLISLLFAVSCKKEPPKGDLPPATPVPTTPAPASPPTASAQGSGSPHGFAAEKTAPKALETLPDGRLAMGPFTLVAPPGWTAKPVTSNMRAANFVIPTKAGTSELVVTYFGPNGAGGLDENIDRWLRQISQPDGKSSREAAKIEKVQLAGQDATIMSVTGHFAAPAMPGGSPAVDKPDQSMLAAIVGSPQGPYYFKLVVDKAAFAETDEAFRSLLKSLKLK